MRSTNHTLASLMAMAALSMSANSLPASVTQHALRGFSPRARPAVFTCPRPGLSVRQHQRAARKARAVARNRRAHR